MKKINIAIDGPSGAGKSSLAKKIAKELDIVYVDTGALYRSIGYYAKIQGLTFDNIKEIIGMLEEIKLDLCYKNGVQSVILNGSDVSDFIRTSDSS